MSDKKLIMFDFDGVLVNTLSLAYGINVEVDKSLTLPEYQALFNGNISEMVKKTGFKGNPDFYRRYAEEARTITVPEDVKAFVRSLAKDFTLSVISGSETSSIRSILSREGIADCFADVMGYDVDTSKVVRIKMLLREYGIDPKDTIFITDTSGDVYEATEAKVRAVAVTWGYQAKDTLAMAKPMAFAETVPELADIIARFFSEPA